MQKSTIQVRIVLFMMGLGLASSAALAAGFRLQDHDAFATGRGDAFAATADNPSAIYYNPAGITQLEGHNVRAGFYSVYLDPSYESPSGGSYHNQSKLHAAPQLYYAYTPEKFPLAFGLGLYAPYGLGVRWPQDTGFRSLALEGKLQYMTLNPVVAWKIIPSLSIAAGPTLNYSTMDLRQGIFPQPHNDVFKFEGDDTDVGFNTGIRWQPLEKLAFGATYRSQTTMNYSGNTVMQPFYQSIPAEAAFSFPQSFVLGVSYRPTPKWNLEFNADFTGWSCLQTVVVHQQFPVPPIVLDWEDSWCYEFGVTRYLGKGWRLSAGYVLNENAMPDAHYSPLIADMVRHFFSVGVGHQGKHLSWDVAYQFGLGPERTVSGSAPSMVGQTADGQYGFISHALSASIGWHF